MVIHLQRGYTLLQMKVPTREQFVVELIDHVKVKFPLVKIVPGDEEFTLKINGQTASLENLYRIVALRPEERLHHIDRWVVELLRAGEGVPDAVSTYEELRERILPMILPGDSNLYKGVVTSQLVEGLMIGYALDRDRTISYISQERFSEWDVSIEDLHDLAIENLVKRSDSLAAHASADDDGKVNLILFQTMDGYDASRILLPTLHDRLREYLGSPFGAAIPNRDILLCFRDDKETVGRLRDQVKQDYQQMPHQVTDQLLLVTPDGLAVHE